MQNNNSNQNQIKPNRTFPSERWTIILRWLFFNRRCFFFLSLHISSRGVAVHSLIRSLPLSHSFFMWYKNDVSGLNRKKSRSFGLIWYAVAYKQLIDCGGIFTFLNAPSKTMKERLKTTRKWSIERKRDKKKYQRFLMKKMCICGCQTRLVRLLVLMAVNRMLPKSIYFTLPNEEKKKSNSYLFHLKFELVLFCYRAWVKKIKKLFWWWWYFINLFIAKYHHFFSISSKSHHFSNI